MQMGILPLPAFHRSLAVAGIPIAKPLISIFLAE
jgi:hypothetical protein